MIKVCHVIDHMGLGGAQNIVVDLLETHSREVHATVVGLRDHILPDLEARLADCGRPYRHLAVSRSNPLGVARIRHVLRQGKFDVAHMHLDYSNSIGIAVALSLGSVRPKIVSHIHNDPWHHNSASFRATARLVAPGVAAHVVSSPSVIAPTLSALGSRCRRVEAILPGIDFGRFADGSQSVGRYDEFRAGARFVIGYAGRLASQKRIERLLHAMPALLAAEPQTRLIIAGEGPMKSFLESETRRLDIRDAVNFVGYLQKPEELFAVIDAFVMVSAYESFGIVVAEAMASSVPVVATDIPGISDFVTDGHNGLLVDADDPVALSSGILRLRHDLPLRKRLCDAGREMIRKNFLRESMTQKFEDLYVSLLEKGSF